MISTVVISGRDWLWPAVGLLAVAVLALLFSYWRARALAGTRFACVFLKLLGLLALAFCLLEPLSSGQRARPGANLFAVLADNSQGMRIKDRGAKQDRGEELRALLSGEQEGWQAQLEDVFQVRRYYFDARLQSTRDFAELDFDGRASSLGHALRGIAERHRGQPLAGVLVFTDGNATDMASAVPDLQGLPPIYPVVIGRPEPVKDIALQQVAITQTAFEDAPVTVQAEVVASGYAGMNVVAQLLRPREEGTNRAAVKPLPVAPATAPATTGAREAHPDIEIVAEQIQKARRETDHLTFRFQFRPSKPGISFYQVQVAARDDPGGAREASASGEATLVNNSRVVVIGQGHGPYRVLYVSGRPNWEYKYLNRALSEDPEVQLSGLIRLARREPKFEFKGRRGESSNPLFRGFDKTTEETERYDQPVLIRVNTRDESELQGGFPKTPEELFAYHAVVLDDVEAEFFNRDQMVLLQKFVSERGGGLLMLGGQECFGRGGYHRTPVGDVLPVYVDPLPEAAPLENLRLSLTREGWLQPWVRLRTTEPEERARLAAMPPFQVVNRVRGTKPGASTLAVVEDPKGAQYPALVVQRFGAGRSAALMVGDLWRWGLQPESLQPDLGRAWRQMVRWLVADVPAQVALQLDGPGDDPNTPTRMQVRVRDAKFLPVDNATVTLQIAHVDLLAALAGATNSSPAPRSGLGTNVIRLMAEPSATEVGTFTAAFVSRDAGAYRVEAIAADGNGTEVGRAEAGWSADPAAEEFRSLSPNRALLETIARDTQGEVIEAAALKSFVAGLPRRQAPVTETWTSPLWHQPLVFLFALACFLAEWGLRRLKGLP